VTSRATETTMRFSPIAIVGHACVLPGALDPTELITAVLEARDLLGRVPAGRWELAPERALVVPGGSSADRAYSDRGGYVTGFEGRFDATGFALSPAELAGLDPLFLWVLHTAREALRGANVAGDSQARTGAIFGNLSFPSDSLSRYAEQQHFPELTAAVGRAPVDPRNRFMSGLPAQVLAQALTLGGDCFALDAACASSLYAIKLACDALHDGRADRMLAGAVNRADDLFIHVGFTALGAQSPTGRSRPFHAEADGLVPGEGAGFVVLERLEDALANGRNILGVIRGAGLSNDGRGRGMLAPSAEGQVRAMRTAYEGAGIDPRSVQYVECHATGTKVGDATEIASMSEVFAGATQVRLGSLKANTGHLITVAGVAGVIKVVEAMRRGELPPTPHVDKPHPALAGTPFRVLPRREPWHAEGPRLAGVSAFGFGGNNAHVIVEEYRPAHAQALMAQARAAALVPTEREPLALVALGARVGDGHSVADLVADVDAGSPRTPRAAHVDIGLKGLRTPPRDLEATLAQQTLLLAAAREAWTHVEAHASDATRVGVLIGCQCDAEVARYGARWRLAEWGAQLGWSAERVRAAQDSVTPVLEAAGVLGTMPNIPANRLSGQLDARGPGFAISAEELSGVRALEVGARMLRAGELDMALVGAVDLSCEPVHEAALASVTGAVRSAGDAAVVCVLMRASSARAAGLPCIALLDTVPVEDAELASPGAASLFGHAHAAVGLLDVVVAALRARTSQRPVRLRLDGLLGATSVVRVLPGDASTALASALAAPPSAGPSLSLPAHLPSIPRLLPDTAAPTRAKDHSMQTMPPAPSLPSVGAKPSASAVPALTPAPTVPAAPVRATAPVAASVAVNVPSVVPTPVASVPAYGAPNAALAPHDFALFAAHPQHVAAVHQQFVAQQAALHQQFLALRQHALVGLVQAHGSAPAVNAPLSFAAPALHHAPATQPAPHASSAAPVATPPRPAPLASAAPAPAPAASPAPVASSPAAASVAARPAAPQPAPATSATPARPASAAAATITPSKTSLLRKPTGPSFDRAALEVHAGGTISQIFGPLFAQQDVHSVQVRMPEPPLLLADRVTGIAAEAGSMKKGTVWTETDVREDSWWLNQGYMPAGIMIESGQADLFLISYLGVDFLNRGERATACSAAS
jgi:3-oxoacyl-(acyl-carrier-protein) synthase